jgi:DNA-binding LacI/PurR family transcriptional regulator
MSRIRAKKVANSNSNSDIIIGEIMKPLIHQTKTQALSTHLRAIIEKMEPNAKLPTMQKLCEQLGVSAMTLHRALSELEAQEIIYRRQGSGTFVAPRAENVAAPGVALVYGRELMGENASPFGAILLDEAERRAEELSERFSLFLAMPPDNGQNIHPDLQDAVQSRRVRGALYLGPKNLAAANWLEENGVPVVSLSFQPFTKYRVKIDHAHLARLGVKTLAEQGCKKIALLFPLGRGIGRDDNGKFPELDAFQNALKKHGLEYSKDLAWRADEHGANEKTSETNWQQGTRAVEELFTSTRNAPDGLVIHDDMMTRGVLSALRERNLKNIHIATHANKGSDVLAGYENHLTRLEIDPREIATVLFDLLETRLAGKQPAQEVISIKPRIKL